MPKPFLCTPSLALAALLLLPVCARAGTAVLLRDIADDPLSSAGSEAGQLTPFKGQAAFVAAEHNGPYSVWVSDGTGPGTRSIFQGCDVNDDDCDEIPEILGVVNGRLLFSASPEGNSFQRRLWASDGTRAGTVLLTTEAGLSGSVFENVPAVVTDKFLYFLFCEDGECALWRSNGTPAGTVEWKTYGGPGSLNGLVLAGDRLYSAVFESGNGSRLWSVDTRTGAETLLPSFGGFPDLLTAAGGKLFFVAPDGENGSELWVSDGTANGTRVLTHFEAAFPFEETEWMKEMGGRVYFVINDVVHGFELWRSDGTPQGTQRITDFGYFEALEGLEPASLALAGGKVLFRANDGLTDVKLWATDGRPESTAPFRSLCPSADCALPKTGSPLVQVGGKAFIAGENGIWSTDGTFAGTHRIAGALCTSSCYSQTVFQELQGKLVFTSYDAAHGIELWTSDGTLTGTKRLSDVPDNTPSGFSYGPVTGPVVAAGPWIYFLARDRHGVELWVTDGRETRLPADIGRHAPGSDPSQLTRVGDRLFFTACDQAGVLWTSGGTPETTLPVPGTAVPCSSHSSFSFSDLKAAAGRLFFLQPDAARISQLWSTGGGAPVQVTHVAAGDFISLSSAVEFQGRLLVPIRTGGQVALWQSDAAGTGLVKLLDLPQVSTAERLQTVGNEVYFLAFAQEDGLWRTDGTPAGTRQLAAEVYPNSAFVRAGGSVLFTAESRDENGFFQTGLWKTDGTPQGTVPVEIALPEGFNPPQELTAFEGNLYFFLPGSGLWRSDGTRTGTALLRAFADEDPPVQQPVPFWLTVFAGKLFFAADDGVHGRELWTSDGTAAGTRLFADLRPGSGSSQPSGLSAAGNHLYFAANDGFHGAELWESDGTAAGTRLIHDIAPEGGSSQPAGLTVAGSHLFFSADDGLTGREPWALPLAGPAGCQPSSTRLCLNGGRYRVEASWLTGQGQSGDGTAAPLSSDTGYFWFFSPTNVEAIVKVLDGQGVNGHVWVFYGALSNVEYSITVTDTQTGLTRRYFNPLGQLASVGDTHGFGPLGANAANPRPPVSRAAASPLPLVSERAGKAAAAPCQPSAQRLCLNDNRFAVEVSWKDFQNHTGKGTAVPLTGDTGTFWFFNSANVELVVKALDGRPVNGKFWLFYGALSNVEYTLTVTDTQTGTVRTYKNPSGRFASVADTAAF